MTDSPKLCPDCASEAHVYTLKLIPSNRQDVVEFLNLLEKLTSQGVIPNSSGYALRIFLAETKYRLQVKESCENCGRYIRFVPQIPELIDKLNQKLEGIRCG